jgi:hypothetical protein
VEGDRRSLENATHSPAVLISAFFRVYLSRQMR